MAVLGTAGIREGVRLRDVPVQAGVRQVSVQARHADHQRVRGRGELCAPARVGVRAALHAQQVRVAGVTLVARHLGVHQEHVA